MLSHPKPLWGFTARDCAPSVMVGDGRGGLLALGWCCWWLPVAWGEDGVGDRRGSGVDRSSLDSGNKRKEREAAVVGAEKRGQVPVKSMWLFKW